MARKAVKEREKKRHKLTEKYREKREALKRQIKDLSKDSYNNFEEIEKLTRKLANDFPANAIPGRIRNRCNDTGRPRGVYRKFGFARNKLREHAMAGDIPGLVKSSW